MTDAKKILKREYDKTYRLRNREKINEQKRIYEMNNKDKQKEYSLNNKDKIKERKRIYYIKNKEKIKERQKLYRSQNANRIYERARVRKRYTIVRYKNLKRSAGYRGLEFSLTLEQFQHLIDKSICCPIRGVFFDWNYSYPKYDPDTPSFDRIDTDKGYIDGNVVVVSFRANTFKSNMNMYELKNFIDFYGSLINE